ncbi:Crp/Fnr family transcriptional regulator [Hymenobacter sp. BRD128]|uniref:Crp/Fnr family transcriptional regulator n=1 Tax=Hymenobacter sp. BRD128 TaxID=2675878 RepID=UPI001566D69D|nr:Crp/Fnr family transcriptional regulator [Hymenobacter sp. BRD128]QKG58629.1 Crp/Fnr family transcriptional regulator [Hymenobacter sp. BRD128]
MTTQAALAAHLQRRVPLPAPVLAEMLASFTTQRVQKRQFIVQPGFVATTRSYIVAGAFRAYVIDQEGRERTIQLAIDDWWISDYNSYISQQPATMFVVALETSTVLQITYEREQQLKSAHHAAETFFRIMAERSAAFFQRRIIANLTQTAEERYHDFLAHYPLLAQRVPQYALASYLNMTPEFLSKIRNNKA